ncbi:hypothetical protein FRC10_004634 [Ceratobasidium sp. 414]|nr:hypothetical protein FRC10_004634 [Ceratobasidium sp. 414]
MEKRIAQAQLAVLCPNDDPNRFLSIEPNKFKAAQAFTSSSVVVDISGDQQADLNFVDLPGLITNVGDGGDKSHIGLIQQMTTTDVAAADYENQGAGVLAAEFDKEGKRTVGTFPSPGHNCVLTKPDLAHVTEDPLQWVSMVTNKVNRLANGWYSVKQLDSKQRKEKFTWEQARDLESEFFEVEEPWATIPPEYRSHLGSANLAYQLGNILAAALESRFVELRIEIDRIVRETNFKLRQFPDPSPQEPIELIQELLGEFYRDIRIQMVEGDPSAEDAGVVQTLRRQACAFREQLQSVVPVFLPRKGTNVTVAPDANFVHQAILRETGDFGSFDPARFYMERVSNEWAVYALDLLDEGYDVLSAKLGELVSQHFSKYSHGGLCGQVGDLAHELLRQCKQKTETQLKYLSAQEAYPRTFHHVLYDERRCAYQEHFTKYGANGAAVLTMARTLALFEFAFRRFADMAPLTVDLHFVNSFGNLVGGFVTTKLNLMRGEEELAELLRISDPMLAQRDALLDKVERLKAARARLSGW